MILDCPRCAEGNPLQAAPLPQRGGTPGSLGKGIEGLMEEKAWNHRWREGEKEASRRCGNRKGLGIEAGLGDSEARTPADTETYKEQKLEVG